MRRRPGAPRAPGPMALPAGRVPGTPAARAVCDGDPGALAAAVGMDAHLLLRAVRDAAPGWWGTEWFPGETPARLIAHRLLQGRCGDRALEARGERLIAGRLRAALTALAGQGLLDYRPRMRIEAPDGHRISESGLWGLTPAGHETLLLEEPEPAQRTLGDGSC